jgi:hypothetical protein
MATRVEQQHRVLKARGALSLYRGYGRVPKEAEIDQAYHLTLTRRLYEAMPGIHALHKQQTGQLELF